MMSKLSDARLQRLASALENAVARRESGEGGGHAALIRELHTLGRTAMSSQEAEAMARQLLEDSSPPEIHFPVVQDEKAMYPLGDVCLVCGVNPIGGEGHPMVIVNAGALVKVGDERYAISEDAIAFFTLAWHAQGIPSSGRSASVDVADMVQGGQFDLYFCSTQCLRAFFNRCVDALEQKIAQLSI